MKIYIVQAWYHDFECSHSENIKAFSDKESAELFKLEIEENTKKCSDELKAFRTKTQEMVEPYMKLLRQRKLTEPQVSEYQALTKERYRREQELKTQWANEDRIWYDYSEDFAVEIDELELG